MQPTADCFTDLRDWKVRMRKAKVTAPAVCTNLGPGVETLSLALALHVTVTMVERSDTHLLIETHGEAGADLSPDCYHPVMYGAVRMFQQVEDAPPGLRVDVRNNIPLSAGLGAEDAMTVAGLVAANSLMGAPLRRDELIALGAEISGRADGVVAAMVGGLTISAVGDRGVIYRRINVSPFKVLIILPEVQYYSPENIPLPLAISPADAIHNIARHGLTIEALRTGDFKLLARVLNDRLLEPALGQHIPGCQQAVEAAIKAGAAGVTISDKGPALLIFTQFNHYRIADAVQAVFDAHGLLSRVWTLTVDTQGVVVTAAETLPA